MEFLAKLGLDVLILIAIVGISEYIKNLDTKQILKRIYFLLPLLLSFIVSLFITVPFSWRGAGYNVFIYFGISTLLYNVVKKTLLQSGDNIVKTVIDKLKGKPLPGDKEK